MVRKTTLAGAAFVWLASMGAAWAYQVQPMTHDMAPTGPKAATRIQVTNNEAKPINVEILAFRIDVDTAGKRTFNPADAEFTIFPPQATVAPGATQAIQARYVSPDPLSEGRIYVLQVKQLNVSDLTSAAKDGQTVEVGISQNFNTTAVIQPANLKTALSITAQPSGAGPLTFTVKNDGPGVADLSAAALTITRGGATAPLAASSMKYGETPLIPPGRSRTVTLAPSITGPATIAIAK